MLEGEAYWGHIRSLKSRLYLIETLLIIAMGAVIIFFTGDFSTSPFFLAIDVLLWFVLVMLFAIMIQSVIFRILQVRIAKSASTKHIMTINSIKKAFVIIIVSVIVAILLGASVASNALENSLSFDGTMRADSPPIKRLSGDPMGLSKIESISLYSEMGATVYIVTEFTYDYCDGNLSLLRTYAINIGESDVDPDLIVNLPPNLQYMYLYLIIDDTLTPNGARVDYTLNRGFTDTLAIFVPTMAVLFGIANAAWMGYLWSLRKKFASESIYK